MTKTLVIVQDVPTQFDVPLYAQIHAQAPFDLHVFYTASITVDRELGHRPQWDHLSNCLYHSKPLSEITSSTRATQKARELSHAILELKPQHVVISGYWPKLHRDLLHQLNALGISVGLRSDNTLAHSRISGVRGWVKKHYLNRLLKRYDYWHPTGSLAEDYLRYHCKAPVKAVYFPYNVDNHWFADGACEARDNHQELRQGFGIAEDDFVVLGIMKWHEREDPMTLINAFKQFSQHAPKAHLLLLGDGPLGSRVRGTAKALSKRIHLPGYMPYSSLPALYGIADVFVHPAQAEPWGVSINESLASGTPVIASSGVGSARDLINAGSNGDVFEAGDTESLVVLLDAWRQRLRSNINAQEITARCQNSLRSWNYAKSIENFCEVLDVN